ncbi:Plasmodium variant antigen protein Cir/Yir/Bir, putative, partial [Plasmodium chabaudi adami]
MQNHKRMCNLLLEGDSYFNDENVYTQKFNKHSIIKAYCRNGGCKTNEERINALTAYIFKTFKDSIVIKQKYNHYDECLLMWVSDKLFKMDGESKDKKRNIYNITLNQAYEKHLKKHKVILDYWPLFDIIGDLKNANLKYMSEFYKLLSNICKTIVDYKNNGAQSKNLSKYSANCSFQYKTLYMNVSECKPYLDLLNKLKGIYDDFRNYAIKNNSSNNELATKLKKLTPKEGEEMPAAYEKHLKKHKVILDYWPLFDIIGDLKNANLKYMSEFYKLLSNICKTIVDYKNNGAQSKNLSKYSANCSFQYKTLYMNVSECKPYLDLLNKLKGIYDDFRNYAIKNNSSNNELATKLKKLTPKEGEEMPAVRGFKSYNFSKKKCYPQKKNTKSKKTEKSSLQPSPKEEPPPQPQKQDSPSPPSPSGQLKDSQHETQQSSLTTSSEDPPTKLELPSSTLQEPQKPGKNNQNALTDSGKEAGGPKSEIKGPKVGNEKKSGGDKEPRTPSGEEGNQVNEGDRPNSESGDTHTEKGGPEGGSADKVSETGDPDSGKGASKGGTDDVSGGDQGSPDGGTGGGPGSDQIDQGSPEGGTTDTKSVQDGVSDDQISNGTQGGANKSQQGTSGGPGVPGVPGSVSGGGQGSKVGDSGTGAGGASGDTESSSTGSEHLDNGSHDQDSGSDAGDKKGLPIGPNPRTLSLTSGANKEGSNDGEGNRNNE